MPDHGRDVDRRGRLSQRVEIALESGKARAVGVIQQVERRGQVTVLAQWRNADAAVAGDHGGDPLGHLEGHVGLGQHSLVIMGVGVDEARCDHLARGIDTLVGLAGRQVTEGADTPIDNAQVCAVARCFATVDERAAFNDEVERMIVTHVLVLLVVGGWVRDCARSGR
ncbi:hypothetical protein D3C76_1220690 [compost metagenome]